MDDDLYIQSSNHLCVHSYVFIYVHVFIYVNVQYYNASSDGRVASIGDYICI